jgi:hypothetical protein
MLSSTTGSPQSPLLSKVSPIRIRPPGLNYLENPPISIHLTITTPQLPHPTPIPLATQLLSNKRYRKWTRSLPLWIGLYLQLLPRRTTTDLPVSTDPFTAVFQFFPSPDVLTEGETQT